MNCTDQPQTGTNVDGGYAEHAYARTSGLVRVPDGLSSSDAALLLCVGITTYSALDGLDARPGSLVAVQGIGGLGHLGVQYAKALGYRVAAIARGTDKAELAARLGADEYVDSSATDPGAALRKLGGAAGIVATAASGASMSPLVAGLAPDPNPFRRYARKVRWTSSVRPTDAVLVRPRPFRRPQFCRCPLLAS
ncbi:zinc-binding dehydrogenase [Amycolatopsis sp. NPDC004368]